MSAPAQVILNTVTTIGTTESIAELGARQRDLLARAHAAQGDKAFAFTRRAAAHHEAGHAVVPALDGILTKYCKVKRKRLPGADTVSWIGFTDTDVPWSVTPDTSPENDARNMRRIVAGWASEILFEGDDLSLASSVDEAMIAGNTPPWTGHKLGEDPKAVFRVVMLGVLADLTIHERYVRAIAAVLMRERMLRGPRLYRLLPPALSAPPAERAYPAPLLSKLDDTMAALAARLNG